MIRAAILSAVAGSAEREAKFPDEPRPIGFLSPLKSKIEALRP